MRIYSWNVNGIRAVLKKGELDKFLAYENPDILCVQETKANRDQVEVDFGDYVEYWNSAVRPGYAGTAIFVRNGIKVYNEYKDFEKYPEITIEKDTFGDPLNEGRVLTLEFKNYYLVTVYVPNSKRSLERLKLREDHWDPALKNYIEKLQSEKPVVLCGDFNAAHKEIDLARPKDNMKNAGFTIEERRGIDKLLSLGLIDTFRMLHPTEEKYTWWTQWGNCRANNVGWRIDYFFISESLEDKLKSAEIYNNIFGSDHCPVSIELEDK